MSSFTVEPTAYAPVDSRIARLEAHAEHAISDLREIRTDRRDLSRKVDQHFYGMLGAMSGSFVALSSMMAKGFHWL